LAEILPMPTGLTASALRLYVGEVVV
jgi:hypothetical protein